MQAREGLHQDREHVEHITPQRLRLKPPGRPTRQRVRPPFSVPQHGLDHLDVGAADDDERCRRVPQLVKRDLEIREAGNRKAFLHLRRVRSPTGAAPPRTSAAPRTPTRGGRGFFLVARYAERRGLSGPSRQNADGWAGRNRTAGRPRGSGVSTGSEHSPGTWTPETACVRRAVGRSLPAGLDDGSGRPGWVPVPPLSVGHLLACAGPMVVMGGATAGWPPHGIPR